MAQQSTLDSSASSSASPSASTARRLHKVPGHFNDARLLAALFTSHTSHTSAPSPPPDGAPREAVEDGGAEGDVGEEKDGGRLVREADAGAEGSQGSPLLPLTRELALIVVRDLRRLWLRRADGLRLRCLMDEQLRPLTPPHPLPLEGGAGDADGDWHGLFLHLLHRLLLRLSGVSASMEQLRLMREQSPLIGRAALRLDTASRRRFLTEPYSLSSPHNSALSPAVLSSMAAFSARQSRGWFSERRNPLAHLRFSTPLAQLDNVPRMPCPHCKRQVSLYCPEDLCAVVPSHIRLPTVILPVSFDILHHHQESVHKSTSVHACVLSPSSCRFISLNGGDGRGTEWPAEIRAPSNSSSLSAAVAPSTAPLPSYDPSTTLLLYPSERSVPLSHPSILPLLPSITRVVVIESTWQKGGAVFTCPALGLSSLPAVHLDRSYESTYWRYQELGRNFLSTLEAIYHCCRELIQLDTTQGQHRVAAMHGTSLDDLLYLYAHRHQQVHRRYDPQAAEGEAGGTMEVGQGSTARQSNRDNRDTPTQRQKPPPRAWRPTDPTTH